jgi:hypothetical protein
MPDGDVMRDLKNDAEGRRHTLAEAVRAYIAALDNPSDSTDADRHLNTLRQLVHMPRKRVRSPRW